MRCGGKSSNVLLLFVCFFSGTFFSLALYTVLFLFLSFFFAAAGMRPVFFRSFFFICCFIIVVSSLSLSFVLQLPIG